MSCQQLRVYCPTQTPDSDGPSGQVAMFEDVTLPLTHLGLCTTLNAAHIEVPWNSHWRPLP